MAALGIVVLCVLAAVAYGIAHDQVTARVCVEYFTVFHPMVLPTTSPTILGLVWGVIATWWMGLFLGLPLALIARAGPRPKLGPRDLVRPIGVVLLVMASMALTAGLIGHRLGVTGQVRPARSIAAQIEPERHARFLADLWAHNASYLSGFLGGIVVWGWAWRERGRRARGA